MSNYIGEVAGLATSLFFAINAVFITKAGEKVGSVVSNRVRVVFALGYLMLINLVLFHEPLPFSAERSRWMWLSLSGVIGLALGDAFLFQSYLLLGTQVGMLLLSLSPVIGALEAWLFLGETLSGTKIAGIVLTLAGIMWVILARGGRGDLHASHRTRGVMLGLLAATCQATGLALSKQGLGGDFSPFQANAIRMSAALVALVVIMVFQRQTKQTVQALRENSQAVKLLAIAGLIGPVLGVSASLLSVQYAEVGIASTLTSLSPVFMIPLGFLYFGEEVRWQAVAGTLLAVAGVAVLFLA